MLFRKKIKTQQHGVNISRYFGLKFLREVVFIKKVDAGYQSLAINWCNVSNDYEKVIRYLFKKMRKMTIRSICVRFTGKMNIKTFLRIQVFVLKHWKSLLKIPFSCLFFSVVAVTMMLQHFSFLFHFYFGWWLWVKFDHFSLCSFII